MVSSGQNWGFPACYGQTLDPCASRPQPLAELDEHAALSGIAIDGVALGSTVGTSAIVAEWGKGKVQRVVLQKQGTAYTAAVEPFLTGIAVVGSRCSLAGRVVAGRGLGHGHDLPHRRGRGSGAPVRALCGACAWGSDSKANHS